METTTDTKQTGKDKGPRTFHERMPCKLTDLELVERGAELGKAFEESEQLETERKATNDGFKARIELIEGRKRELSGVLRSKTELREVELVEEFVFRTNTAIVKRADTGETIRTRALTKSERQEELPGIEAPKKDDGKANGKPPKNGAAEAKPAAAEAKAGTEITDPQKVLNGDVPPAKPAKVRVKKGKKKS